MHEFNTNDFCKFLRNRRYKISKYRNRITIELNKSLIIKKVVDIIVYYNDETDEYRLDLYENGTRYYRIWCYDYNYFNIADGYNIFMFEMSLSNNIYERILNLILYLFNIKPYTLICVARLYENTNNKQISEAYKDGYRSHRVNNYPPLDSYGKHIGYVLTILGNNRTKKHIGVINEIAKTHLDKYISLEYLPIKYTSNFSIDTSINEKKLLKLLKQL